MKINKLILLFCAWSVSSYAEVDTFKNQLELVLSGESSGYSFAVPSDVYEKSSYSDLRDMRIINATGDFVPMRTFLVSDEVKHEYSQTSLPTFKLNKTITHSQNSKQVRTTRSGTHEDYTVVTAKSLRHYLESLEVESDNQVIIDASILNGQTIESLEIQWEYQTKGNRIFSIDLAGSNDLSRWNSIKRNQQLIEINANNKTLLENKISLSHINHNISYKFYRITFLDKIIPEVTSVQAQLLNQTVNKSQKVKDIVNFSLLHDNIIIVDTAGFFPVESFKFSFNQNNTITDVKIYSRTSHKKKWRYAGAGTTYSMTSDGITVKQDTVKIRRSNHRHWKIQLDENVKNTSVSKVEMNWRNHQVEFLAQGQAPFTLVYTNSTKVTPASRAWYNKIPRALTKKMFSNQVEIKTGTLSELKMNKSVNSETIVSNDYSRWIFWGILAIVLLVLFFMAYRLIGESTDNKKGTDYE